MQIEVKNKEAFMELQGKLNDFARNLGQVRAKIQNAEREKKRSELTLKELHELPESTNTFKAIGKTFMLVPTPEIRAELTQTCSKSDSEIEKLLSQAKYLEKQMNETEASAKELIIGIRK